MRALPLSVAIFVLLPVLAGVLGIYARFVFGTDFMAPGDTEAFVMRVLTLLFSGFLGLVALAYAAEE